MPEDRRSRFPAPSNEGAGIQKDAGDWIKSGMTELGISPIG